jgi:Tol biopolymer transport system component
VQDAAGTFEQWMLDLSTGSWSRPVQSGSTSAAAWVPPDGREILFYSDRVEGRGQVFVQRADRSAPPERLWPSERAHSWLDVSADGQQVILIAFDAPGFFVLDRRSGEVSTVIGDRTIRSADFHPAGDWIVYARRGDDGYNLWLAPFPGPGEPRQVTFDGGEEPRWSIGADEIYYRGPTHLMAMPVEKSGGTLATGLPRPLFEDRFRHASERGVQNYSVHLDGRFLMIESADSVGVSLVLVENWRAKLVQAFAQGGGG